MVRYRWSLIFSYPPEEPEDPGSRTERSEYIKHTSCYIEYVKAYDWDPVKNEKLKDERGISFEDIVFYMAISGIRNA